MYIIHLPFSRFKPSNTQLLTVMCVNEQYRNGHQLATSAWDTVGLPTVRFEPEQLKHCVSLVFVKWAKCDFQNCTHWTHLTYCCKQRVVRRQENFECPCHAPATEE